MENERIARLEEQGRWMANSLDRLHGKVDMLIKQRSDDKFFKGKIIGAAMMLSFIASMIAEWIRR